MGDLKMMCVFFFQAWRPDLQAKVLNKPAMYRWAAQSYPVQACDATAVQPKNKKPAPKNYAVNSDADIIDGRGLNKE